MSLHGQASSLQAFVARWGRQLGERGVAKLLEFVERNGEDIFLDRMVHLIPPEIWQMSSSEYLDLKAQEVPGPEGFYKGQRPEEASALWRGMREMEHRKAVRDALRAGLPVPLSIQKEFEAAERQRDEAYSRLHPHEDPAEDETPTYRPLKPARPTYKPTKHYTRDELELASIDDLIRDARAFERQAAEGPFFPEKGITRESRLRDADADRAEAYTRLLRALARSIVDSQDHITALRTIADAERSAELDGWQRQLARASEAGVLIHGDVVADVATKIRAVGPFVAKVRLHKVARGADAGKVQATIAVTSSWGTFHSQPRLWDERAQGEAFRRHVEGAYPYLEDFLSKAQIQTAA